MAREINLVPDIKNEFIKTLKFRNLVFFMCIVISAGSLVTILVSLSIAGGQQGFITAKQNTIDLMERKINEYNDLGEFLTIRDQLSNIQAITDNKVFMSRTFNILSAIIPVGADYINISELSIDLTKEQPTFTFDAQANAGTEPYIDYNVLDSFKKSMQYMRYDYGKYVDKNGDDIPAYCIIEAGNDGATFKDPSRGYYAYWLIDGEGCNPAYDESDVDEEDSFSDTTPALNENQEFSAAEKEALEATKKAEAIKAAQAGYEIERYNDQNVVRIWRTPQYAEWYRNENIDLDGEITGIPHFESSCITYRGTQKDDENIVWTATNETCKLIPGSEDPSGGIDITQSSNGRNSSDELVLRFSAVIPFAPEVFNFNNHHMLALSPSGRRNVTDSYSQIQSMFAERAADCAQDDTACITTPTSSNTEQKTEEQ